MLFADAGKVPELKLFKVIIVLDIKKISSDINQIQENFNIGKLQEFRVML